jgi:hypothetical protein
MIITDAFDHKAAKQCNVFLHKTSLVAFIVQLIAKKFYCLLQLTSYELA